MKILFYCLWGLCSVIIVVSIVFNHYAESYLNDYCINLLFNEYSKQWAYLNAGITCIWLIFTWIGLHLLFKGQPQ